MRHKPAEQAEQKCPCCNDVTLSDDRGSAYVCQNCYWQYDGLESDKLDEVSKINGLSLREARKNYSLFGVFDNRLIVGHSLPSDATILERIEGELNSGWETSGAILRRHFSKIRQKPKNADRAALAERASLASMLSLRAHVLYKDDRNATNRELKQQAGQLAIEAFDDAFPPGIRENMPGLKSGNLGSIEIALRFLEIDPWYHGSGYIKSAVLTRLCHLALSADCVSRLQRLVLNIVRLHDRREFRYYCKIARLISDDEFRKNLEPLLNDSDKDVSRRARWVIEALQQQQGLRANQQNQPVR